MRIVKEQLMTLGWYLPWKNQPGSESGPWLSLPLPKRFYMGSRPSNPLLGVASHQVHSALARLDDRNYSEFPPNFHPPICPKTIQNLFRNTKKMKKVPTTIIIHYTPTISNAFFSFNQMQPPPADRRKPRPTSNPIGHPGGGWAGRGRWDTWDSNSGRGYHGWMASGWWLDDGWWFLLPSTGSCMRLFCRWEGVKFMMFFWCDTSNTSSNDASVQYRCRSLPNTSSIPVWFWFDLHAVSALQTSVEMLRVTENLGRSTRGPADPPAPPAPPSPCWAPAAAGHALGGGGSCCRWSSGEARPGTRMACPGVGPSFPHDILWMLLLHR